MKRSIEFCRMGGFFQVKKLQQKIQHLKLYLVQNFSFVPFNILKYCVLNIIPGYFALLSQVG